MTSLLYFFFTGSDDDIVIPPDPGIPPDHTVTHDRFEAVFTICRDVQVDVSITVDKDTGFSITIDKDMVFER